MCLLKARPAWEDDVVFANRHAHHHKRRIRVSETIITRRSSSLKLGLESPPIIVPATPPKQIIVPTPPASPARIEIISISEDRRTSPRTSRVSVSTAKGKSRRSTHGDDEVYIERERERVRLSPPVRKEESYDTYRYVEGQKRDYVDGLELEPSRSQRSITYETNPRHSGRVVERERVVIEDGGRRREYYRRP